MYSTPVLARPQSSTFIRYPTDPTLTRIYWTVPSQYFSAGNHQLPEQGMTNTQPIFVRMNKVQEMFGVSDDQVRIWARQNRVKIFKRGRMSFVRTLDLANVIEGNDPQPVG